MSEETTGKIVGGVTHYFGKIGVGIIKLSDSLKTGDTIRIQGHSTDFEQSVETIQIDHKDVAEAKNGDVVGIKVSDHVREGDKVYKVA